jgi:hypothetical protein
MQIRLVPTIPKLDGYYLLKMSPTAGLHLVLIHTELDGARVVYPDDPKHKAVFRLDLPHAGVFTDALWSETPIEIV